MKIKLEKINKCFENINLFNNFSYEFKNKTFYSICGVSGCGKTTLLNIISGIIKPDSGNVTYNNEILNNMKEDDIRDFRLKNVGFVFQSYNLFEEESVLNNIYFINDSFSALSKDMKKRKINEVLRIVGIENLKNKIVKNLSGGEKQRVAIARALVNNPKVIFADEPTGSLDGENGKQIFNLLRKISSSCIVICVTHDEFLAENYSDIILKFDDSKIIEKVINNPTLDNNIQFMIERKKNKKIELADSFLFSHTKNFYKNHKIRSFIIMGLLTISLFSTGLSFSLKDNISNSLNNVFKNVMNENSLILKRKNNDIGIVDYYPINEDEVNDIFLKYSKFLDDYGICYKVNFEEFFKDRNILYNLARPLKKAMEGFNARSFNEFEIIDIEDMLYPSINKKLRTDEICLALTNRAMRELCEYLQITKEYESLGSYLEKNCLTVDLYLENHEWGYEDDYIFTIKSVIPSTYNHICHTDNLFNENLFEGELMFPSSNDLLKIEDYPWVLKKIYYFKVKEEQTEFLNLFSQDERFSNYILDNDCPTYSPLTTTFEETPNTKKLFLYKVYKNDVPPYLVNNFKKINPNLNNYYYSTIGGYINLGTDLFTGFSKETYFSNSLEKINNVIDAVSQIKYEEINNLEMPRNTLFSSAINLSDNNVKIISNPKGEIIGEKPKSIEEVNISTKLASLLNINKNNEIYLSAIINKSIKKESTEYNFRTIKLQVVGLFENDKCMISGMDNFSIYLFRDLFKFSAFDLLTNAVVYEFENKVNKNDIDKLNGYYNDYIFCDPFSDVELGINDTLSYLQFIIFGLAILTALSASFLLIILNYIQIQESKKDYIVLATLGFRNSEIRKMTLFNISLPLFLAFILSSLLLFGSNFLIEKIIGSSLNFSVEHFYSIKPYLLMSLLSIIITICSMLFSKISFKKQI